MQNNKRLQLILAGLLVSLSPLSHAADLETLFTTPAERQLINSNRYKSDEAEPVQAIDTSDANTDEVPLELLIREEVTREYRVSGISVSQDGPHTVWINSETYADGEQLEDDVKIKVLVGDEVRVRITAPDGKHYYALSGETLEVTYLAPVEN